FKLTDIERTPGATLQRARDIARRAGLRHVYTGNIRDRDGQSTHCVGCGKRVIDRDGYSILGYHLDAHGACSFCGHTLVGRFDAKPGLHGAKRARLSISS
ncbi:MAG TPA: hypothetical protein VHM19_16890, partial [Polyangiales bacterium]|nr:hypothetical protein [Polyangiales bacterium]